MSQKRQPEEEKASRAGPDDGGSASGSNEKRQKVPALKEVILEALKMNRVQKLLAALEPLVRRVVKEEVELALANHLASLTRQCGKQMYPSTSRSLQLQFRNKFSLPIFTGTRIEGEDSSAINIALVDGMTGKIVETGPESTMKIEIVVLEGDFEGSEEDNWTFEEFKNNIVREREGKRSLLTGDVLLDLNEGIGVVGEISFTDNSSWTRSRKFKLGARVVDCYFNGVRVREAKTEPFMVKDHRGELYKKHYPPLLWDEVWRLEKIGKDGAFHKRLTSENINCVKDFLTLLSTDAPRLRNILGSGMSTKMWEVTVEHARTCMLPNQMYVYFAESSPQQNTEAGVVFNVVGEVMGLLSQNQFISIDDLSESQKADAHSLVKLALEHWNDVVVYNDISNSSSYSDALPTSFPPDGNRQSFQDNIYISNFGPSPVSKIAATTTDGGFVFGSPPEDIFNGCVRESSAPDNAYAMQSSQPPHNLQGCRSREELEGTSNSLMLDECVGSQTLFISGEDNLHRYLDSDLISPSLVAVDSPADLGTAVTGFLAMAARSAARDKANTVWGTLVSVLKWRFSIMKIVPLNEHGEPVVVSVPLSEIDSLSSIRIPIPKDLLPLEARENKLKTVSEVLSRFSKDGIPLLDPEEDMKVQSTSYRKAVRRIELLESLFEKHDLWNSPLIQQKLKVLHDKQELMARIKSIKKTMRASTALAFKDELKARKRVLRRLGYVTSEDVVQLKGRVACEITSADEVTLTELMFSGVLKDVNVEEMVALLSCFVWQEKLHDAQKPREELDLLFSQLQETARRVATVQLECKIQIDVENFVNSFRPDIMEAVYAWAKGSKFFEIMEITQVFEGSLIRAIRRLEEVLQQLILAAKSIGETQLEAKFEEAVTKIKRDIVFAASLYL